MARLSLLVCVLLVSSFYLSPTNSYACSCAIMLSPEEEFSRSYAVFAGKVTGIEEPPPRKFQSSIDPVKVTFDVKEAWKGNVDPTFTITTARSTVSCGFNFQVGQEYIVYADGDESLARVSLCSRTALLAGAEQDLQSLGRGAVNSDYGMSEVDRETKYSALWWTAGLVFVIVLVAWIGIHKSRQT